MATSKWESLCEIPNDIKILNHLFAINESEFLIAPSRLATQEKVQAIYKYNVNKNQFELFHQFSKGQFFIGNCMSYDAKYKQLYIFHAHKTYITIDMKTKHLLHHNLAVTKDEYIGRGGRSICSNDGYAHFIIGGTNKTKHFICDKNGNVIKNEFPNDSYLSLYSAGFIYLKSKATLIAFGGINRANSMHPTDKMYEYSMNTQKWNEMKCRLPEVMRKFSFVVTGDDKYMIIFGGEIEVGWNNYDIQPYLYVFDLNKSKWYKSKIELPSMNKKGFRAARLINIVRDRKIVYGYLRDEEILNDFGKDIVELIAKMYTQEFVHIIQCHDGRHWRVSINDILHDLGDIPLY